MLFKTKDNILNLYGLKKKYIIATYMPNALLVLTGILSGIGFLED